MADVRAACSRVRSSRTDAQLISLSVIFSMAHLPRLSFGPRTTVPQRSPGRTWFSAVGGVRVVAGRRAVGRRRGVLGGRFSPGSLPTRCDLVDLARGRTSAPDPRHALAG